MDNQPGLTLRSTGGIVCTVTRSSVLAVVQSSSGFRNSRLYGKGSRSVMTLQQISTVFVFIGSLLPEVYNVCFRKNGTIMFDKGYFHFSMMIIMFTRPRMIAIIFFIVCSSKICQSTRQLLNAKPESFRKRVVIFENMNSNSNFNWRTGRPSAKTGHFFFFGSSTCFRPPFF